MKQRLWRGVEEHVLSVAEGTPAASVFTDAVRGFSTTEGRPGRDPRSLLFGKQAMKAPRGHGGGRVRKAAGLFVRLLRPWIGGRGCDISGTLQSRPYLDTQVSRGVAGSQSASLRVDFRVTMKVTYGYE
jgi:hypothetical protein